MRGDGGSITGSMFADEGETGWKRINRRRLARPDD